MELKQLLQDEDAVSPVIGVILMVAITVILAAVIGTFVLGLGDQVQSSAPNANFQFEYSNFDADSDDEVRITHNGGQDVESTNLEISGAGLSVEDPGFTGGDSTVETGESWTSSDTPNSGETIRVIWQSDSGGSSNTIGQSTVPS